MRTEASDFLEDGLLLRNVSTWLHETFLSPRSQPEKGGPLDTTVNVEINRL